MSSNSNNLEQINTLTELTKIPVSQTPDGNQLCIHQMFEIQVERSPQATAVVFENNQLSYQQLNQRANQLAHHLRTLGIKPEKIAGIYLERSLEMVVGLLGILKAGGAYLPLDPAYPSEHLAYILEDSQISAIVTTQELVSSLPNHITHVVCLDSDWQVISQNNQENLVSNTTLDNLIYTIYTSGSTGRSKGVMITHRGICNQITWRQTTFRLTQADKVLQNISLSFDPSVWQIFWPLCWGAELIMARPGGNLDTRYLVELILQQQITVMALVPSMLRVLLDEKEIENCQSLRHITCGGEALPVELIQRFFAKLNLDDVLYNCYGPTEASIDATFWKCDRTSNYLIAPIGCAIANTQIYILNENLEPAAIGQSGELHIGGAGLARGYLNRPDLTSEKFIPDPFTKEPEARLYKTGDLARYLDNGNIEFLGRLDNQVKVRGFRIELAEIEAILAQHAGIQQTVVIATEDNPGDQRLVAYIVPHREQTPMFDEVRHFLKQKLPNYMLPNSFVLLDDLPLTPNGKVDRRTLRASHQTIQQSKDIFLAPQDELELELTKIWQKVLGIQPISIKNNFFEMGGHSLLAVRLFAEIEKTLGKNLPLATLLQASTIEELANILRQPGWVKPWSSLVPIQPKGSKPPFFLVHAVGGNILSYCDLARHLGLNQPVYGLQAQGLDGKTPPHTRIEDMAAQYIKEIRTVQPNGPYFLGGASFGGTVVFEMAQQLYAQGEKVALLSLLDSAGLNNLPTRFFDLVSGHLNNLAQLKPQEQLTYIWERLEWHISKRIPKPIHQLFLKLRDMDRSPQTLYNLNVLEANLHASKNYLLQVYPSHLTLFRAKLKSSRRYSDPLGGWGGLALEGVEVHEIPGDHTSILIEPHVQVLAEKLKACLDEAQRL
ncbi:amino acid adenylation domain-containing protein [Nostoc sp. CCY 9925]|uniref:amino acid adenylation domain-containing protein n=1 Tax=Nostoc sp. CCY 9925 TaxID=3103865 RepID=UPI0039C6828E